MHKEYAIMFNAASEAIKRIDQTVKDLKWIRDWLIVAQLKAEDAYCERED